MTQSAISSQPARQPGTGSAASVRWYYQSAPAIQFMNVIASVGGGPSRVFQLDTGSCGIHIGRGHVAAPFDRPDPKLCHSRVTYQPSGITQWGQWTPNVPISLLNPGNPHPVPVATATATVFIVDDPDPYDGGMLGIGYHQPGGFLEYNPLMNVSLPGDTRLSPGYIITREYLEVGLTDENQQGFGYADLQPVQDGSPVGPAAEIMLRGPQFPTPVTLELPLLMDTGVRLMMLFANPQAMPPAFQGATERSPVSLHQTEVTVDLPLAGTPPLAYTFVTDNLPPEAPEAPEGVLYMGSGNGVNTGIHVLQVYDYLFDGEKLRMGFRRQQP